MGDNFNIRDFRNAAQTQENITAERNNRTFYACVLAIPVVAALAGLGYKPLMQMRTGNVQATQLAQAEYEAERRAANPLYALTADAKSGELIDLNRKAPSLQSQRRNEYAKRALNAYEFLNRVDAKAHNFDALEMETLKYTRTQWALRTCNFPDLKNFYTRSNQAKYETLAAREKTARETRNTAQMAKIDQLKLPKIESQGQALAFIASGGIAKHQKASMDVMVGFANLTEDAEKIQVRQRRQKFNKTGCMNVRTIVQSGTMNLKTNRQLR